MTKIALPLRASPMQGWLDAVPYVKTKYSLLLHNDGYALDSFFGCELVQALKARQRDEPASDCSPTPTRPRTRSLSPERYPYP